MRSGQARAVSLITLATAGAYILASMGGWANVLAYAAGFIPARVGQPDLFDHAGLPIPLVPVWLTPLTSALLHGGLVHLGFNLVIFLYCGRLVEQVIGARLLWLLYGIGAYAAAAGQWLIGPSVAIPMIGASGAISTVIGAYALLFGRQEVRAWGPVPARVVRMLWLGAGWVFLQTLIGIATSAGGMGMPGEEGGGIAIGAHIGGFLAGMLLTMPLLRARFRSR